MTHNTESPLAAFRERAALPQASGSGGFYTAGLQAEQPSGSPDGHAPSAADVRFVSPAPVVSSAAFRERAALPGAAMPRAFSTPHPISLIDDGRGCTMPDDIGRDQCAACWRPSRTGDKRVPAAMLTLHSGSEVECVDRVHMATVVPAGIPDKHLGCGGSA